MNDELFKLLDEAVHRELIYQSEMAGNGAWVHDIRNALNSYLFLRQRLQRATQQETDQGTLNQLVQDTWIRRRCLELTLGGTPLVHALNQALRESTRNQESG